MSGLGWQCQPIISGFRAVHWIARFVIIMCFTPIYIQQHSRLAVTFPGSRRLGWGGDGLKAVRAIICSENALILWGIEGQGEQPSKVTIYCPGACTLKLVLSKLNVLAPPAGKKQNFPCAGSWNGIIRAASQCCALLRLLGRGFLLRWPHKDDYLMVLFSSNVSAFNCSCRTANRDMQESTTWYHWSGDQHQFPYLL